MSEKVGGSFTVSVKETKLVLMPSVTDTWIKLIPVWFVIGIMVKVRFVPLTPITMFVTGIRLGLEEEALRPKLDAGVSASEMFTVKLVSAELRLIT